MDPITAVVTIATLRCVCDYACKVNDFVVSYNEKIEPDVGSLALFALPDVGNWIEDKAEAAADAVADGYHAVVDKVEELATNVKDSVLNMVTEKGHELKQYFKDVMVYHNRTNPLKLMCKIGADMGFCKCEFLNKGDD